ncbi:MAG: hypothetical protein ACJ8AD_21270 [Gemmatimonadaceae bacterium]
MRVLILLPFAVILILLAAVTIEPGVATAAPRAESAATVEVGRIRAHFDSVLTELAARDVAALTTGQRAERSRLIHTLYIYKARGVFPHNYDFPERPTPYFMDRKTGTLCAVAHLLASTGRRDIVDRVARADNNVWVAQLATDTAFTQWLSAHGLTLGEAARIQMPYMAPVTPAERARNVAFLTAAPVALGGSVIASLWNATANADGHRRVANVLGLGSGALAIGMGATLIGNPDVPRSIGVASVALGGVSMALAARAFHHHSVTVALEREAEQRRARVETSLAPIVPSGSAGAGLSVSLRF